MARAPSTYSHLRGVMVPFYGWTVPTTTALAVLARHAPLIEIGAGVGYWAWMLRRQGTVVEAYDRWPPRRDRATNRQHPFATPWTEVRMGGPECVRHHPDHTLFLCWPSSAFTDEDQVGDSLAAYTGTVVIYVGESDGGCTDGPEHLREAGFTLKETAPVASWPGTHDRLEVWTRGSA